MEITQCPRCGGGRAVDAQMCQWCGFVDPDSPLGRHQAKAKGRRDLWIVLAVLVVLAIAAAVFLTTTLNNSKDNAQDDACEFLRDEGIDDLSGDC